MRLVCKQVQVVELRKHKVMYAVVCWNKKLTEFIGQMSNIIYHVKPGKQTFAIKSDGKWKSSYQLFSSDR